MSWYVAVPDPWNARVSGCAFSIECRLARRPQLSNSRVIPTTSGWRPPFCFWRQNLITVISNPQSPGTSCRSMVQTQTFRLQSQSSSLLVLRGTSDGKRTRKSPGKGRLKSKLEYQIARFVRFSSPASGRSGRDVNNFADSSIHACRSRLALCAGFISSSRT
jgi:hypothetical protein